MSEINFKKKGHLLQNNRPITYWIPAISYMTLIFVLSSFSLKVPAMKTGMDKLVHFVEYGILSFFFFYAFSNTTGLPRHKIEIVAVLCTVLYGISDEIHQYFVPNRCFDLMDILANTIGAMSIYLLRLKKSLIKLNSKSHVR